MMMHHMEPDLTNLIEYQKKLMSLLERVCHFGFFGITIKNGKFCVTDYRDYSDYVIPIDASSESFELCEFSELDFSVTEYEKKERERKENVKLREEALSKLTKEDKEILGLES